MKILFISQYFYPENFKGNDIVFDFVKKGYDITVLTAKPNYPEGKFYKGYSFFGKDDEVINGAKVIRSPIFPRKGGNAISLVLNYISFVFFSYFTMIFKIKEKYDVIFVQQLSPVTMALPGLWIKKRQKIPLILWVLDLWPESIIASSNFNNKTIIKLIDKVVRRIYKKSDIILTSSKRFKESILEKCENKAKRIEYFPNWAEDTFLRPEKLKIELPKFPKGFNIMFAGGIGEAQGFETVLKAAKITEDKNINWLLIGEGRKDNWIKREIEKEKLTNVYLFGRYPLETMPHFFKKADVMLVSLKEDLVFSLTVPAKIQAYMASSKVILGVLNGEGKDLINESKSGFAVSAGDFQSLANESIKLVSLENETKKMMEGKALKYYENNFSKEKLFSKLELIFKEFEKQ